ncbi:thiol:disulfide interchange protein DsbA/DsbL [beta proteobacterium MWH-UniP1]
MNRRRFSLALAAASVSPLVGMESVFAQAQQPDEGIDYRLLREPVPTSSAGKIEVLEFFWYACPHCYHLEPHLAKWKASLGSDVAFKKVHVAFRGDTHQKIFYTLEALGQVDRLGPRVFDEIHQRGNAMGMLMEVSEWAKKQGIDVAKFESTWNSFGVQTQQKRANALTAGYKVDGVPMFGINGRYVTSPAMVGGSHARALQVVDYLIARERKTK